MSNHDAIKAFMAGLRADREELVMLRKVYSGVLKAMNAKHKSDREKLEAVCDALPDKRKYAGAYNEERTVELSPPVLGYQ